MRKHDPVHIFNQNQLVEAVYAGNLDAAVACNEAEATFITKPGQVATGTKALRIAFAEIIAMKITLTTVVYKIIQTVYIVLHSVRWSEMGTGT